MTLQTCAGNCAKKIAKQYASALALAGLWAAPLAPSWAADYPQRPIEIVVPSSPGGGTDMLGRIFADVAKKYVAQAFIISNKPGAGGSIGMTEVQRARPDGYKIAMLISELAILPHLGMTKLTTRDFAAIAQLNGDPGLIAVRADSPLQNIEALLAQAREQAGGFAMGNAGTGTIWHLAAGAIERETGVRLNHVPFQGAGPSVLALLGGHLDALVVSPAEINVHVEAGSIRVLGSMTEARLPAPYYDQVPTLKEQGVNLVLGTWRGLGAPPDTPAEVVQVLREVARQVSADPDFHEALKNAALMPAYRDAEPFQAFMDQASDWFAGLIATLDLQK